MSDIIYYNSQYKYQIVTNTPNNVRLKSLNNNQIYSITFNNGLTIDNPNALGAYYIVDNGRTIILTNIKYEPLTIHYNYVEPAKEVIVYEGDQVLYRYPINSTNNPIVNLLFAALTYVDYKSSIYYNHNYVYKLFINPDGSYELLSKNTNRLYTITEVNGVYNIRIPPALYRDYIIDIVNGVILLRLIPLSFNYQIIYDYSNNSDYVIDIIGRYIPITNIKNVDVDATFAALALYKYLHLI